MITKEVKTSVIAANATHEGDTGSPEVQIAILTQRIRELTEHLKNHPNDTAVWACTKWSVSAAASLTTSPRRTSSVTVRSSQS